MDLDTIKRALNRRSLTQAEQWALVAEVEELRASRAVWRELAEEREAERDALAAQVATYRGWFDYAKAFIGRWRLYACDNGEVSLAKRLMTEADALANLPAAAARYLAADRVAQMADFIRRGHYVETGKSIEFPPALNVLIDDWEAAGRDGQ